MNLKDEIWGFFKAFKEDFRKGAVSSYAEREAKGQVPHPSWKWCGLACLVTIILYGLAWWRLGSFVQPIFTYWYLWLICGIVLAVTGAYFEHRTKNGDKPFRKNL